MPGNKAGTRSPWAIVGIAIFAMLALFIAERCRATLATERRLSAIRATNEWHAYAEAESGAWSDAYDKARDALERAEATLAALPTRADTWTDREKARATASRRAGATATAAQRELDRLEDSSPMQRSTPASTDQDNTQAAHADRDKDNNFDRWRWLRFLGRRRR